MTAAYTWAFPALPTGLPKGVDIEAIADDLADNGVAAPADKDQTELAAQVAAARADGLPLSVVVLRGTPEPISSLRDLATKVGTFQDGTVAVFSDNDIGTYSDSISRVRLEWAEDVAKGRGGHSAEAVQILVHRLEQPETLPWTAITSLLLTGMLVVVGGLYWIKRRRGLAESVASESSPR